MSSQALVPVRKKSSKQHSNSTDSCQTDSPSQSKTTEAVKESTDKLLDDIDRLLDQDAIKSLQERLEGEQTDKPLTLSDLMREGSSVTGQAIGQWTKQTGETCALSAAMLAARARGLA